MPNRMLRDWTDSETMNSLSVYGERFFVRLIMKADDFGCYHADSRLLKSFLFPLLPDGVREADISRWLGECEKAGLIVLYESAGKRYLQIKDFRQRLDKARNKFPLPDSIDSVTIVHEFPAEVEEEKKPKGKEEKGAPAAPRPTGWKKFTELEFYQDIARFAEQYPKDMLRKFYEYWKEPSATGIMRFQLEKTWDTHRRLGTWQDRDKSFVKKPELSEQPSYAPPLKPIA